MHILYLRVGRNNPGNCFKCSRAVCLMYPASFKEFLSNNDEPFHLLLPKILRSPLCSVMHEITVKTIREQTSIACLDIHVYTGMQYILPTSLHHGETKSVEGTHF